MQNSPSLPNAPFPLPSFPSPLFPRLFPSSSPSPFRISKGCLFPDENKDLCPSPESLINGAHLQEHDSLT